MLRESLERVLRTGQPDHLAVIPYRVPIEKDGAVVDVDRTWSATHIPVLDANGEVAFILQHTVDVTSLHDPSQAAEERAPGERLRTEAGVLTRARAVEEENERVVEDRERMRGLFEQAPGFMCVLEGPSHVFRLANAAYQQLVGRRELVGKSVAEALPEVVEQGFITVLDGVYTTGKPFLGEGMRVMLDREQGRGAEERFVDFVYQPVRDDEGAIIGIFVQGHDVTAQKLAQRANEEARRSAEAFARELEAQSREVRDALDHAHDRIKELEAKTR
jgi:PAS domain S-box-containing protein